ncbi:MAG: TfoX/Sxy family protein [Chloroflexi bacterium]|nr:TfoX/Sxy family protein [Chloroflexota bacterium]
MKLSDLPNIGEELEKKLELVGIHNPDELIEFGSINAVRRISDVQDAGCINMLYALEGAIQGIRWHHLPAEHKQRIKDEFLGKENE